ncbi:MAG: cell-division initiation protein DivIVA [Clostridiaceae bacterium]|jgi:cell division initiation protein|nr:cell-division initiation protein DivIVA [Clostridiaceae bacterium]
MKITSMDITNKDFKRSMRGYNCDEVDEFLDKISEDYETLYKENSSLREKISTLDERVSHFNKMESTIQNTLVLAQNAAEQAKLSAEKESELIIRNANDTAQRILDKAHNDVININDEYERVKQEFTKFRNKYRNFMKSQLEMFDDMEKDFIKNYNIGSTVEENLSPKEIQKASVEMDSQNVNSETGSDFKVKDLDESYFEDNSSANEIKNFFVK